MSAQIIPFPDRNRLAKPVEELSEDPFAVFVAEIVARRAEIDELRRQESPSVA